MKRALKVHYVYNSEEEGTPRGASYCTPKTVRKQVSEDPRKVTCKACLGWAQSDIQDEEHMEKLRNRPWYDGLFRYNKGRQGHSIVVALVGLVDTAILLLTLGNISSGLQFGYLLHSMQNQAEEETDE